MMPLPLSLALMLALLGAEWFYVRTFFRVVEPALVARVETALEVKIGFGPMHHWEVRDDGAATSGSRFGTSLALFGIQLAVMVVFALGLLALAGLIFGPAIWFYRRS